MIVNIYISLLIIVVYLTESKIGFDFTNYSGSEGGKVQVNVSVISGMLNENVTMSVRFRTANGTAKCEL